jgi:hypothetical protein
MDKHPVVLYKTLVIVIIVLFVGASVIPLVGSLSIQKSSAYGNTGNSDISLITIKVDGEIGLNDWFVDTVFLNFTEESDDIAEIIYCINGGAYQTYFDPIYITEDGEDIMLEWQAIDYGGNYSDVDGPFFCSIDKTKPEISLTYDVVGGNRWQGYDFEFTATATDAMSSMERVEFYLNNELKETVIHPGPEYIWKYRYWPIPRALFWAKAYDIAGNSEIDEIIEPCKRSYFISENAERKNCKVSEKTHSAIIGEEVFDPGYVIVVFKKDTGENSWLTNASIPISYEQDRVAEVYYKINNEAWMLYTDPVVFSDGFYNFSWYVIDSEGYVSTQESLSSFQVDATSPELSLAQEKLDNYKVKFTASVSDETSGVNKVEFYDNHPSLKPKFVDFDFPYEWTWSADGWRDWTRGETVTAIVYDNAGNSNICSIDTLSNNYGYNQERRHGDLV